MSKAGWSGLIASGNTVSSTPVAVPDRQPAAGGLGRVQHDEARAIGREVGERIADRLHRQPAGRFAVMVMR